MHHSMEDKEHNYWQPRHTKWNGEDFYIELPPIFSRIWGLTQDDGQEDHLIEILLSDTEHDYSDEIHHGFSLLLHNESHTLRLDMIVKENPPEEPFIPDSITSIPGTTDSPTMANVRFGNSQLKAVYHITETSEELVTQIRHAKAIANRVHRSGETNHNDDYVFIQRGSKPHRLDNESYKMPKWKCRYEGSEFDMPDTVATQYLIYLIKNKGREFKADELARELRGTAVLNNVPRNSREFSEYDQMSHSDSAANGVESASKQDLQNIREQIGKTKSRLEEIIDDPDYETERSDQEVKLHDLYKLLHTHARPGSHGKSPKITSGDTHKAANIIGKQMREMLHALKDLDKDCYEHFSNKKVLQFGLKCRYSKESGHNWHIDPL
jgi:hypothetical protein